MAPTRKDQRSGCPAGGLREELVTRSVAEVEDLAGIFEESLPAFGASDLRRVWKLADEAIGRGVPLAISIAGPAAPAIAMVQPRSILKTFSMSREAT